jgi:predicted Abi (CAAX) family protease
MDNKSKNVFISHYGKDDPDVQKLRTLMNNHGYTLRNSSIDSTKSNDAENENYIKYSLLRPGINWAGTVIVLIGDETHTRDWVNWEIQQAQKLGTRVVGVYINGLQQEQPPLPEEFNNCANALVGWTGNSIIDAIEGRINNFQKTDGSNTDNIWSANRSTC